MSHRALSWCVWCGPAFLVVFFAGALLASLVPPPAPSLSAAEAQAFWSSHTDLKRLGLVLMMVGGGFIAPFSVALAAQMKRMEGAFSPMTYLQLVGGALGTMAVLLPSLLFMACAFRPERPAEVTQGLMDLAFIPFVINWPPAVTQCIALAVVALGRHPNPLFPRWVGYYSLWTAFLFLPGSLLLFFKSGAWAWDGLLTFWLVAALFGGWFLVMTVVLRRSLRVAAT